MTDMVSISRPAAEALLVAVAALEDLGPDEQLAVHDLQLAIDTPAPWTVHPEMAVYWRACIAATPDDLRPQIEDHSRLIGQEMRLAHLDPTNPHTILAAAYGAAAVLSLTMRCDRQHTITPDNAHIASQLARQTFTAMAILGLQAGVE